MTTALAERIFQAISEAPSGSISFADYMRRCLYDSEFGYYTAEEGREIGRGGDFFTSVSVGAGFGFLLGWAAEHRWREWFGEPKEFRVVEQGAHDGRLARDFLAGLRERRSPLAETVRYLICEPDDGRRKRLEAALEEDRNGQGIEIVDEPPGRAEPGSVGLFLCNELLDAFPVHRLRRENGAWWEWRVRRNPEEGRPFAWVTAPLEPGSPLAAAAEAIPCAEPLPENYTTEICLEVDPWMAGAARWFERGAWWVIDYGREADDYFSPERSDGTLRGYREHRRCDDPFKAPGETDLTADVNFTDLNRAAVAAGLERVGLSDQHHFLIKAAEPWLREIETGGAAALEANRKRLRQFQTLTHPGLMGRAFKVAEYRRD